MDESTKRSRLIRFSVFELDRDSGELFKQGRKVKLQGQPFELLVALLERPGEVVTREDLQQKIWPSDTVVDFDPGLNRAINKVREALGDSAESPRFIETLPRRGYRFIGSIQLQRSEAEQELGAPNVSEGTEPSVSDATTEAALHLPGSSTLLPSGERQSKPRGRFVGVTLGVAVIAGMVATWAMLRVLDGRREIRVQQLTTNSVENPVWHAVISPDGNYLAYGDLAGIQVRVISTGESHLLPKPRSLSSADAWFPAAWFADGTHLLATSLNSTAATAWTVSVIGGAAAPLRDNALVHSTSPDGSLIAFTSGIHMTSLGSAINTRLMLDSEIWIMGSRGENARRVVAGDNLTYFGSVRWSPDGKRIAYQKLHLAGGDIWDYTIESRDLTGGMPEIILSERRLSFTPGLSDDLSFPDDMWWLPDGRIIHAVREAAPNNRNSNLWQVVVDSNTGKPRSQPRRITNLAGFHMEGFSVTGAGKRLVFESTTQQSQVYVGRLEARGALENPRRLTLDARFNIPYAWTSDSKAVIFNSDRTGTFSIYRQGMDQDVPELIPTGPQNVQLTRVSPDGAWLIYTALFPNERDTFRFMRVPLAGGAPQVIMATKANNFDCPRRAGAQCIASEVSSKQEVSWYSFDPASGARHPLFEVMPFIERQSIKRTVNWTVSPDGSRIALTGTDPQGGIEIRSLTGQIQARIVVRGWANPLSIDWAADGKSLFVSNTGLIESPASGIGATLLRVDLEGHVQPLWVTRGGRYAWAIASPDGRYLAIRAPATERNAWMIENF